MRVQSVESSSSSDSMILIDGSYGEGGGQIIRNAITLACILRRKINVVNIRANRPNPGLASQHLESLLAMLRISGATSGSTQPKKKDIEFELDGRGIQAPSPGVQTEIDLITAGSCTLSIQCILPYLLGLTSPSRVKVIGGTHVMKSPSYDYFERIFLQNFGSIVGPDVVTSFMKKPGYFPRGGGIVDLVVDPLKQFPSINITERGELKRIDAVLNVTAKMERDVPQLKKAILMEEIEMDPKNIEVRTRTFASVEYFLHWEKSHAGFSYLVEGRNPQTNELREGIGKVKKEVNNFLESSAAVDCYMQDQLIIYMTLAKLGNPSGQSRIRTIELTDHTTSAIHVASLFFGSENAFEIVENADGSRDIVL